MEYFVKDTGKNRIVYKSLLIESPKSLGILANKTALDLVKELSFKPLCAMDLARRLGLHEQKVYYNLRNLEKAGIIKLLKTEERTGGTAKIYTLAEPVVSVKLAENAFMTTDTNVSIKNLDLLRPFVEDGKLNAKIILGNPHVHGKYDESARDGVYAFDLALFLGNFLTDIELPCFMFDTQVKKEDLNDNLILIGNPKFNTIVDRINSELPVYFDKEKEWSLVSKTTNKVYDQISVGVVIKCKNPFNKKKKILILAGKRTRGTKAAIIAFTQHTEKIMKNPTIEEDTHRIILGLDKDNDYELDHVKFLE